MTYTERLREAQDRFCKHQAFLVGFARSQRFTMSVGDAWRVPDYQKYHVKKGVSWTLNSQHLKRLAIDFNFFLDDYYLFSDKSRLDEDKRLIEQVGDYWERLHPNNVWGGRWVKNFDPAHFQTKV